MYVCSWAERLIALSINLVNLVNIKFCIAIFFDGNTLQNSFFNKKVVFFCFFFFFHKNVEGSEIVGVKIFRSNSQASMIFITYILLKMSS